MPPIYNVSYIFTDTGMPSPVILLSANGTAPCFRFLLRQCPCFHGVAKNALIALHGKLNKIAQAIACFLLPGHRPCCSMA